MLEIIKKVTSNCIENRACIIVKNKNIESLVCSLKSLGARNQEDSWAPISAKTAETDMGDASLAGHYFLEIDDDENGLYEFCIHSNNNDCVIEYV